MKTPSATACTSAALFLLGATAFPQGAPDAATAELLARVEAARGRSTKALDTLAVEGTFEIRFDEAGEAPIVTGTFREAWAGRATFRHTGTMEGVADIERGFAGGVVWEIEPHFGAKVHDGAQAAAMVRYAALLRGAPASELYRAVASDGTRELDGVPHVVLKMTPPEGDADLWWIEPASARVARIDLKLPTPHDCVLVFGFPEWSETRLSFGDWKRSDGADFPCQRVVRMGSMEIAMSCTKVERGATLDPQRLELPDSVVKAAARVASASPYELIERALQPTATIRFQCKAAELNTAARHRLPRGDRLRDGERREAGRRPLHALPPRRRRPDRRRSGHPRREPDRGRGTREGQRAPRRPHADDLARRPLRPAEGRPPEAARPRRRAEAHAARRPVGVLLDRPRHGPRPGEVEDAALPAGGMRRTIPRARRHYGRKYVMDKGFQPRPGSVRPRLDR